MDNFFIGASEEIAKAYAEELARHGISVILISNDISNVADTAKAISDAHGVEAIWIKADFSQGSTACRPIRDAIAGKDIGFIINSLDGSLDTSQDFTDLSESAVWDTINRNVVAATLVTRLALPAMVERGKGAVVNISAGRCLRPTPRKAPLSASTVGLSVCVPIFHPNIWCFTLSYDSAAFSIPHRPFSITSVALYTMNMVIEESSCRVCCLLELHLKDLMVTVLLAGWCQAHKCMPRMLF